MAITEALEKIAAAEALMAEARALLNEPETPITIDPLPLAFSENIVFQPANATVSGLSEHVIPFIFDCSEKDLIIYPVIQLAGVAGEACVISLENADRSKTLQVGVGYNFNTLQQQSGRVSLRAQSNNTYTAPGVSGMPAVSSPLELRIHIDSDFGYLNLWVRDGANWKWVDSCAAPRFQIDQIRYYNRTGGPTTQQSVISDVWACLPPAVSIGDSITAGHPGFDPNGSQYAGIDNGKSQWQAHCFIPGQRNSVIVNKGIGSTTTAQTTARIYTVSKYGIPVFLSTQNNDAVKGVTLEQRSGNVQASINYCLADGCPVVLYGPIYHNNNPAASAYYKQWNADYLPLIQGHTLHINPMDVLTDPATGNVDATYVVDDVHPNQPGYTLFGGHMQASIAQALS